MTWRGPSTKQTAAGQARAKDYRSAEHKQERARRLAVYVPGPCWCPGHCGKHRGLCGRPLTTTAHLPHLPDRSGYYQGLWCPACNRVEASRRGALIANAKRKRERLIRATPYRW